VAERRIKCALLTVPASLYDAELTLACPGLEFVALTPSAVGLPKPETNGEGRRVLDPLGNFNPFALPEDDSADVVLIESHWFRLAAERHPERIDEVMRNLERRADLLIGLDADQFALGFPPSALERLAVVIEFDGLYRDRDLYNYFVGCRYPGANWTEKLRPRPSRYRASELDKLRLSVPCFMRELPAVRRAARARLGGAAVANGKSMSRLERIGRDLGEALLVRAFSVESGRGRPLEVHCLVGPTHPQRIEAIRLLEGFSGKRGILVYGVEDEPEAAPQATGTPGAEDDDSLPSEDDDTPRYYREWIEASSPPLAAAKLKQWRAFLASAKPFARKPVSRQRYLLELRLHQVAVAPTGYGELTYRHGEALMTGAALVCQDLGHVETMFPFRDRENVAFCRPDLSDLRSAVEELLRDGDLRRRIARDGRRSYTAWAARWREDLYLGIEAHIREALGSRPGRGETAVAGAAP
jgi:Glycosyl transferases group 1